MANLPSHPFNNATGPPTISSSLPPSQLPPGLGSMNHDKNLNNLAQSIQNIGNVMVQNSNKFSSSASQGYSYQGDKPPSSQIISQSPMQSHLKLNQTPMLNSANLLQNSLTSDNVAYSVAEATKNTDLPYHYQQQQINDNVLPLISSHNKHQTNGPLEPLVTHSPITSHNYTQSIKPPVLKNPTSQPVLNLQESLRNTPLSGSTSNLTPTNPSNLNRPPMAGPSINVSRFLSTAPPIKPLSSGPPISGQILQRAPVHIPVNGPLAPPHGTGLMQETVRSSINGSTSSLSQPFPTLSGSAFGPPKAPIGIQTVPMHQLPPNSSSSIGYPIHPQSYQKDTQISASSGPSSGASNVYQQPQNTQGIGVLNPTVNTPYTSFGALKPTLGPSNIGPPIGGLMQTQAYYQKNGTLSVPTGPPSVPVSSNIYPQTQDKQGRGIVNPSMNTPGIMNLPMNTPPSLQTGPSVSNMQNRYPQSNYVNQQPHMQMPCIMPGPYAQQYNTQGLTKQMGQLSVTKQGFDQLWGHQMVDLLQCKHILPEYPDHPPEIRLGNQFAEVSNCNPEIFRCTINRIPETNSLLQKSRLPLGILIHPFKDLNHLPVIQCNTIVRCRACRTYINPFVYFVDSKRWKCNLCYRVNDLPEEFQYDPVSKSYGDPSRRPEIKSATIEFIAPAEYMLRPPQPAVYLFLLDVSHLARDSGYLQVLCDNLKDKLDELPGDARTQIGFICYDAHVHYYLMSDGLTRPKEMTVIDIDDIFLPSPEDLLVNLGERLELVKELLTMLPKRHSGPGLPASALGASLQAAYKLMAPTGGRITVFQTCLPNIGPGALQPREDPNARSSKEVAHLNPATDFYKRLALDCSGAQVAVDLFLLNSQYADLATLSGMSKFSAGTVYHIPLFNANRAWQAAQLSHTLARYLTRKIGFEAVMRVRCTRGITIHTFHGNFFVRSTDLLSLPNVSPDAGFAMQLTVEDSLTELQQVCFQAALLYTSSKGERRIRVHTLALPIASNLTDVLHAADQQCIIGLLSKMAVDRCASASMSEAREALMNVAVDALSAHRLAQNLPAGSVSAALHAPRSLALLPLYLLALLKRKAFRTGTSTRLDDRVADMCNVKCWPLSQLLRAVYPSLYALHDLASYAATDSTAPETSHDDVENAPNPPRLQLTAERISINGAYLLDDGETMIIYVCHGVSPAFLSDTFGVAAFSQLPEEARSLPVLQNEGNILLHAFIEKLNDDRPYPSNILILRDNSPLKTLFTERLVEDRVESAFSYYEFLQHIKNQVK